MRLRLAAVVVFLGASGPLLAQQAAPPLQEPVRVGASGVSDPVVIREVRPNYTVEAMRRKIAGQVWLEAVVLPNGTVSQAKIVKSLDSVYGLDEEAVRAAQKWLFKPGYFMGKPVPVIVTLILEFRLHNQQEPTTSGLTPEQAQAPTSVPDETFLKGVSVVGTPGVIAPRLVTERKPNYTVEAMRQKIQGEVQVQAVVMPDGSVARARVIQSVDKYYGLDEEALKAVHAYTFVPNSGTVGGQPAPVAVTLTLTFRLH